MCLNIKREKVKTRTKTVYDYKNADIDGLLKYIKEFDFNTSVFSKNVYLQTELFSKVLIDAFTKFVPQRAVCIKPDEPPWLSAYTRCLLRKKNRNYKLFKKSSHNLVNAKNTNKSQEYITILTNKKDKSHKNSRIAANESLKANRRVQNEFYNTVNSTMNRPDLELYQK